MSHQLTHSEFKNKTSKANLYLLINDLTSPANLGSIFRLADAFGVQKIWLHESLANIQKSTRFKRTSRSAEQSVITEYFNDVLKQISEFKTQNKNLIGIELTSNSQNINSYLFDEQKAYVFVLGHERTGISERVLAELDLCLHIDLYGQNSSINVAQSCGIALYEVTRQING